jgi:hypothetical protein
MTFNYQARFAVLVQSGVKRSTIRARRRDGKVARPGETLHHFTGMRTKQCRRLGESICKLVSPIRISGRGLNIGGHPVAPHFADYVAKRDGFIDLAEMVQWFSTTHGLPFAGNLIEW